MLTRPDSGSRCPLTRSWSREIPRHLAVAAVGGLHLPFLLAPPLLSQDAFSYLAYARLGVTHGLDPYVVAPAAVPADAVFAFAGSRESSSVYGPPFTLATYALAGVSVPVRENQARTSSFSLPYKTSELLGAVLPGSVSTSAPWCASPTRARSTVVSWLLRRTWRGADAITMAGWATVALLLCSAWPVPWYLAWLLPLAALGRSRPLVAATIALTAWTLAIAIPF